MGEIKVSESNVEQDAINIEGAGWYFKEDYLCPSDTKSTITVNATGKNAFAESQTVIAQFGQAMEREVCNIRSIGAEFKEYDQMMTQLWKNGQRFQTISSAE